MLPTDRKLTAEEIAAVRRDWKRFRRERNLTIQQVARTLGKGFSAPTISTFEGGHDQRGDHEKCARALNEYMERYDRAAEARPPEGFVETAVARRMLTTIRLAVDSGTIGVLHGPAGVGKSLTIAAAHAMYTGSIHVRVRESTARGPALVRSILAELGENARCSYADGQSRLIRILRGSRRPIFVDEAHKLHRSALEALRDIHDETGCPIILVGTIDVERNISDSSQFYGQLSSRISARCDILEHSLSPKNPRPLYTVDEVRAIFESGRLRLTTDGARFLTDLACAPAIGSLRLCRRLCEVALAARSLREKPIDAATLRRILRQLHGETHAQFIRQRTASQRGRGAAMEAAG